MEKYYFGVTGFNQSQCTEKCKIKGCMIGSVVCQSCENCIEHQKPDKHSGNVYWIKCSKLQQALTPKKQY